jgi:hypothetical protein
VKWSGCAHALNLRLFNCDNWGMVFMVLAP